MNILYICGSDVNDCSTGGAQRTHFLYEALCKLGKVHVLCFSSDFKGGNDLIACGRIMPSPRWQLAMDFAAKMFLQAVNPIIPLMYPFPRRINVEESFPGIRFDVVVVRYIDKLGVVHPWKYGPVWVDIDDHPVQLYDTIVGRRHGRTRAATARWLTLRVMDTFVRKCRGCWVSNPAHLDCFAQPEKVHALGNIPIEPPECYNKDAQRENMLLTVGYLKYVANIEGIDNFLSAVWPVVKANHPEMRYCIAGGGLPDEYAARWSVIPGVELLGYVRDVVKLYESAIATVVPIEAGSGTCIKTMESLAYSRACLSTRFGARGLLKDDQDIGCNGLMLYSNAEEFESHLSRVLVEDYRQKLEHAAKFYAMSHFSKTSFEKTVADSILGANEEWQ